MALVYYHLALSMHIFPKLFEIVALDGGAPEPSPSPEQVISDFHLALIDDGGRWGRDLRESLLGREAAAIDRHHGLTPRGIKILLGLIPKTLFSAFSAFSALKINTSSLRFS